MGMGTNEEIRDRLEVARNILLSINWLVCVILLICGLGLISGGSSTRQQYDYGLMGGLGNFGMGIGVTIITVAFLAGIIGHFLINLRFSIPFILLNNGDTLAALAGNRIIRKEELSTGNTGNSTAWNMPNYTKEETAKENTGNSTVWNMPDLTEKGASTDNTNSDNKNPTDSTAQNSLDEPKKGTPKKGTETRSKALKQCARCEKYVDEDVNFCPHCGNNTFGRRKEETAKGNTGNSTAQNIPDEPKWKCPKCGSSERTIITLKNQSNVIYQCKNCGHQIFA